jgi:hypothetical protein
MLRAIGYTVDTPRSPVVDVDSKPDASLQEVSDGEEQLK